MKTQKQITKLVSLLVLFIILVSCSKDDSPTINPSASDITKTIDEHPESGTEVGVVATNLSGTLVYSLLSETVANAFSVDSNTGMVTINEGSKFDFETNNEVGAVIKVTNSSESALSNIRIILDNLDDIEHFLSDSKSAYVNAVNGEWISITEEEYNSMALSLNEVSKTGTNDADYNETATSIAGYSTFANNNEVTVPQASYIFAFKYRIASSNNTNIKVKISDVNIDEGYVDVGQVLPSHGSEHNYFIIKGNDSMTANTGYIAITGGSIYYRSLSTKQLRYAGGDVNILTGTHNCYMYYQGLSTTQKQWK